MAKKLYLRNEQGQTAGTVTNPKAYNKPADATGEAAARYKAEVTDKLDGGADADGDKNGTYNIDKGQAIYAYLQLGDVVDGKPNAKQRHYVLSNVDPEIVENNAWKIYNNVDNNTEPTYTVQKNNVTIVADEDGITPEGIALYWKIMGASASKIVGYEDATYYIRSGSTEGFPLKFLEAVPLMVAKDTYTGSGKNPVIREVVDLNEKGSAGIKLADMATELVGNEGFKNESNYRIYSSVIVLEAITKTNSDGKLSFTVAHDYDKGTENETVWKESELVDLIDVAANNAAKAAKTWEGNDPATVTNSTDNSATGADNKFPAKHYGGAPNNDTGEYDGNWSSFRGNEDDFTSYIGITRIGGKKDLDYSAAIDGEAGLSIAAREKIWDDLEKDNSDRLDAGVELTINMPALYNLYAGGWASDVEYDDRFMTRKTFGEARGNLDLKAGEKTLDIFNPWLNRQSVETRRESYKHVTINLGTQTARTKQKVKVENPEQLTYGHGVVSMYKYAAVIRDKDGNRFDLKTGNVQDYPSLLADPQEYPLDKVFDSSNINSNYSYATTELNKVRGFNGDAQENYSWDDGQEWYSGDTFEVKVLVDPAYDASNMSVVYYEYDNKPGNGRVSRKMTYNAETDTYSFVIGDKGPYRVYVQGLKPKATRKLDVIPQDGAVYEGEYHEEIGPKTNYFYQFQSFLSVAGANDLVTDWRAGNCNHENPVLQWFIAADEEDTNYNDLVIFSRPAVVGSGGKAQTVTYGTTKFIGHDWPIDYTVNIKPFFNSEFIENGTLIENSETVAGRRVYQHGIFDDDVTNDRYAKGPNFKVLLNDTELKENEDGSYTIPGGKDNAELRFEGVVRAYHVYAPNVAAYDIKANYDMNRNKAGNFQSSVPEGETYRFQLELGEGVSKGPNFKVELAQADDRANQAQTGDYMNNVVRTVIPENKDGYYEFTVKNDVEIIISGIIGGEGFSDIGTTTDEEQAAINWLKDQGILGFGDGTFRPGISTTRAEFVRMLYVLNKGTAGTANFSDTGSHWAAGEIGWGAGKQIIDGYPDGTFKPDQPIRRSEVAQIIWKMAGSQGTSFVAPFPDVNQGDWFAPAINWNFGKQIIQGYTNGNFGPNDPIKRAHIALMLYRANGQY